MPGDVFRNNEERKRARTIFDARRQNKEIPQNDISWMIRKLTCIEKISGRLLLDKLTEMDTRYIERVSMINADTGVHSRGFSNEGGHSSNSDTSFQDRQIMKKDNAMQEYLDDMDNYIKPLFDIHQFLINDIPNCMVENTDADPDAKLLSSVFKAVSSGMFKTIPSAVNVILDNFCGSVSFVNSESFDSEAIDDFTGTLSAPMCQFRIRKLLNTAAVSLPVLSEEQVETICNLKTFNADFPEAKKYFYGTFMNDYKNHHLTNKGDWEYTNATNQLSLSVWWRIDTLMKQHNITDISIINKDYGLHRRVNIGSQSVLFHGNFEDF